jgi:hypothetical protein
MVMVKMKSEAEDEKTMISPSVVSAQARWSIVRCHKNSDQ